MSGLVFDGLFMQTGGIYILSIDYQKDPGTGIHEQRECVVDRYSDQQA